MPHMVVFKTSEGKPGYHLTESLDDSVKFVEHLRNNEQVTDARVFRMQEVPIEFKVLYKVELSGAGGSTLDDSSSDSVGMAPAAADAATGDEGPLARRAAEPRSGLGASSFAAPTPAGRNSAPGPSGGESTSATGASVTSPVVSARNDGAISAAAPQQGGRFGLFSRQ